MDCQLFPNPSEGGRFTVRINSPTARKEATVKVVNAIGQTIYQQLFSNLATGFSKEIDLGSVAKGLYYVEISSGGERVLKKLLLH